MTDVVEANAVQGTNTITVLHVANDVNERDDVVQEVA